MADRTKEEQAIPQRRRDPRVRAYPYPATAWLAISSDPDNTLLADWKELHSLIWEELGLPFADTLFLRSYNQNLPHQVDLHGHPEILRAHPHDTIHTWGDYVWAGQKGFDRSDAIAACQTMAQVGWTPRVWVDHSMFTGNLLHVHRYGGIPSITDASGHVYPNPLYTLDLVKKLGIKYIWDGAITPVLGQDRPLSTWAQHRQRTSDLRRAVPSYGKHILGSTLGVGKAYRDQFDSNTQYRPHRFPDGNVFYTFRRHGVWADADIDGVGRRLATGNMQRLMEQGGTCILYTHMGKRPVARMGDAQHVPENTIAALRNVRDQWLTGRLIVSGTAHMLDHLVLRDHIEVDQASATIRFHADSIAFDKVGAKELAGHGFTIAHSSVTAGSYTVHGTHGPLSPRIEDHGDKGFTLHFDT